MARPLKIGAIYLLLFIRDSDVSEGFHWALYHHRHRLGGYKFNVKQMGSGWICDSAPNNNIMNSFLLAGALRIGDCDPLEVNTLEWIDQVNLEEPPAPYPTFTCRTWTLHCVRGLVQRGFVRCHDVDALEEEAKRWGISHHQSAQQALQPRPVDESCTCIVL